MKVEITDMDSTEDEDIEEDFEVEQIVGMKINLRNKVIQFQVRWKGYEQCDDYWLPIENLSCDELIEKFLDVSGRRDEYMTAMLTTNSSNQLCRRAAMSERVKKPNEASFAVSKRSERGSDGAFLPKESKSRKIMPLSDDINIKTETYEDHAILLNDHFDTLVRTYDDKTADPSAHLEDLLKKKSSSKDCRKRPMNDRDRKEDGASLGMTKRRNESGRDEAFSSKEFKRIKIDQLSDDINIKTECYEDDDPVDSSFVVVPINCAAQLAGPSTTSGYSELITNSPKLENMDCLQDVYFHQEDTKKSIPKERLKRRTSRLDDPSFAGENPFSCDKCSFQTKYRRNLNEHTLLHTGERPFSCDKCRYQSNKKQNLKKHILTHTREYLQRFSCEMCSYQTGRKHCLKSHMLTHTRDKFYLCEFCSYQTIHQQYLKSHILTHTGEKPFSCEICHFRANRKQHLKRHILMHTGEKPFSCELCSYQTNQKQHLIRHFITHTGEKPYTCEMCSYGTSVRHHLKRHILTHTGEKPFSCEMCSYRTCVSKLLKRHILTHTEEKNFSCKICSYQTFDKLAFMKHVLTHPEEKT